MKSYLKSGSVSIYYRALQAMFNWGIKREKINNSSFDKTSDVKQKAANPANYFTVDEIRKMFKNLNGELGRLVFLALETGGRIGELVKLEWDDIDLEEGFIHFRGDNTKTGQRRQVPLRRSTIETIKSWGTGEGRIFRWIDKKYPSRSFTRLLRELKLDKIPRGIRTFHTLRHTFASHLLMNGVDIYTVSKLLGHASVKTTERVYSHFMQDKSRKHLENLPY